jgi:hypothetical protein
MAPNIAETVYAHSLNKTCSKVQDNPGWNFVGGQKKRKTSHIRVDFIKIEVLIVKFVELATSKVI